MNLDWREQGQEKYLSGLFFSIKPYKKYRQDWDHDHCEFCGEKFCELDDECLKLGYSSEDNYRWICEQCFNDFKEKYGLKS